jgi:glycosyltransferase involved in cell wall biosynthesis
VVLTRRDNRDSDSYWKRSTAGWFYKIYNAMARVKIPDNVSDFCLLDREAVDAFVQLRERCRFNKGLFAWIGYEPVVIPYMRPARTQGESSWPLRKLWSFALDGLTSFSTRPLKLWTYIGSIIAALSLFYGLFIVIRTLLYGVDTPGYASLIAVVSFLGGIQLVSLGVLGEYLARVYSEVKDRPVYLVRQKIGF